MGVPQIIGVSSPSSICQYPHRHTLNFCLPILRGDYNPVKLAVKITPYYGLCCFTIPYH